LKEQGCFECALAARIIFPSILNSVCPFHSSSAASFNLSVVAEVQL